MEWEVEFTDEFEAWWNDLTGAEQETSLQLLACYGQMDLAFAVLMLGR